MRQRRPLRVRERVADGRAHVGHAQMREDRAVGEARHAVHRALRVDHHGDALVRHAEEVVRLDDLEALVHQRGRIDGDLGAHRPVGVLERLLRRDGGQVRGRPAAEGAAGAGEEELLDGAARLRAVAGLPAPARHWKSALCSLSTGRISEPLRRAASSTNGPPATMLSLLASASVAPASSVAMVARSPAAPTMPLSTVSGAPAAAASAAARATSSRTPASPASTASSGARAARLGRGLGVAQAHLASRRARRLLEQQIDARYRRPARRARSPERRRAPPAPGGRWSRRSEDHQVSEAGRSSTSRPIACRRATRACAPHAAHSHAADSAPTHGISWRWRDMGGRARRAAARAARRGDLAACRIGLRGSPSRLTHAAAAPAPRRCSRPPACAGRRSPAHQVGG